MVFKIGDLVERVRLRDETTQVGLVVKEVVRSFGYEKSTNERWYEVQWRGTIDGLPNKTSVPHTALRLVSRGVE